MRGALGALCAVLQQDGLQTELRCHVHLQLSPECQDLLDKIFQVDPKQRITLQDIQKHPWYTAALSSPYQGSWDQLEQEQQGVDNHIHSRQLDMVRVACR